MISWAAIGMLFKAASWAIAFILLAKGASKLFLINEIIANELLLTLKTDTNGSVNYDITKEDDTSNEFVSDTTSVGFSFDIENYEKAFELYKKASTQGNSVVQFRLGFLYYFGRGVPQNYEKAFEWHKKSANQGDPIGQYSFLCVTIG
jgi:TPR repeat protein